MKAYVIDGNVSVHVGMLSDYIFMDGKFKLPRCLMQEGIEGKYNGKEMVLRTMNNVFKSKVYMKPEKSDLETMKKMIVILDEIDNEKLGSENKVTLHFGGTKRLDIYLETCLSNMK